MKEDAKDICNDVALEETEEVSREAAEEEEL